MVSNGSFGLVFAVVVMVIVSPWLVWNVMMVVGDRFTLVTDFTVYIFPFTDIVVFIFPPVAKRDLLCRFR